MSMLVVKNYVLKCIAQIFTILEKNISYIIWKTQIFQWNQRKISLISKYNRICSKLSYVAAAAADGWRGNTWFSPVGDSGIVAKPGSWLTRVVISHSKESTMPFNQSKRHPFLFCVFKPVYLCAFLCIVIIIYFTYNLFRVQLHNVSQFEHEGRGVLSGGKWGH